jgi:hypothetical protein
MPTLSFKALSQWPTVVGLEYQPFIQRLTALGGIEAPRYGSVYFDLRERYDGTAFEQLLTVVRDVVDAMEETVTTSPTLDVPDHKSRISLDAALKQIRRDIGPDATERLANFLARVRTLNVHAPERSASLPYRAWAWRSTSRDAQPKRIRTTVFSLVPEANTPNLYFSTAWQWPQVFGFDRQTYIERLEALGCAPKPGERDLRLDLRTHSSAELFERLYDVIREVVEAMEETVAFYQGSPQGLSR